MGGISSTGGIFSGINSGQIIEQLLAIEGRPRLLAQRRILQLQQQQAGYLDLNAKMSALRTAASSFRTNRVFASASATSSNPQVLTATAQAGATAGTFAMLVDRLVSSQQMLSRGFASATAGLNAGTFTLESAAARLDRDTALAELNGGNGIVRGSIVIQQGSASATVDLSRVATVGEVVEAINAATGVGVRARVDGGRLVVESTNGTGITIANSGAAEVAESLGIRAATAVTTVTGQRVYGLSASTAIGLLNDGNGIFLNSQSGTGRFDFQVVVGSQTVNVNIGDIYGENGQVTEAAPSTLGGVMERINSQLATALGNEDLKVSISADGTRLRLVDAQSREFEVRENPSVTGARTAADLGLAGTSASGAIEGRRIIAGMNSTLASLLNGGSGIGGTGAVSITARNGQTYTVNVDRSASVTDILAAFARDTGGVVTASLNRAGNGIALRDTSGGTGALIVSGATAESLKIATAPAGVAASEVQGGNLQRQYITLQTRLSTLRGGQGVGTGTFRIIDSTGATAEVNVGESTRTLDDVIRAINSRGTRIRARINDNGDGLLLFEEGPGGGTQRMRVEEVSGSVAQNLNIRGEGAGAGAENVINGSFERRLTFAAGDGLEKIAAEINRAGVGVQASLINDGSPSSPVRLSLTARQTGTAGRFVIDTGSFDLGLTTQDAGNDAKVFYGSSDPARAVLLTSSRNTLDRVIPGVSIDLKSTSDQAVTLTVSTDTSKIVESVNVFISAYNTMVDAIGTQTRFNQQTNQRGALLGDSTALVMRSELFAIANGAAQNVSGRYQRLADVGITIGSGGRMQLNQERFRLALETDPAAVEALFTTREVATNQTSQPVVPGVSVSTTNQPTTFTAQGVMTQLENLAERYLNSVDGRLTRRDRATRDQIDAQNARVRALDARLASRRGVLERQFLRMEQAIGQLQQQQGALGQIQLIG